MFREYQFSKKELCHEQNYEKIIPKKYCVHALREYVQLPSIQAKKLRELVYDIVPIQGMPGFLPF
jgi:hypothetical protein